jgi:predicted Rossmann fold nucleotide-binding protein DprA/Smf involved in DNA uptake
MHEVSFDHFPIKLKENIEGLGYPLFQMQKLLVRGYPLEWGRAQGPRSNVATHSLRIGVIGTRKPSPEGLLFVKQLVNGLKDLPVILVSGGALGIDGQLHAQALLHKVPTEAWLVGPLSDPSPHFHTALFEKISQQENSCLVVPSGLEPSRSGRQPLAHDWLTRNQWLSLGLDALIVVEAGIRSGTWATVKFALKSSLNIYAVPGSIFNPAAEGTNLMITNGYAHPAGSVGFLIHAFVEQLSRNPYNKEVGEFPKIFQ